MKPPLVRGGGCDKVADGGGVCNFSPADFINPGERQGTVLCPVVSKIKIIYKGVHIYVNKKENNNRYNYSNSYNYIFYCSND